MRWALALFLSLFGLIATVTAAEDRPNTILVMDGSGSMWGQIDEVAKITIAQEVMEDLLNTLPEEQSLGLIAYGHRERGNCTDIELMIEPGPARRDAIAAAIYDISPLGKTPMTDSVIAAAEALRYTEDSATVILVSDGVETCNPDPCAAARILEETGVDFTAHVIGFDVGGDAEATAQMQCIADETGGMFIPASDAGELAEALNTVVEPEIITLPITFQAVIGDDQRLIESPVLWTVDTGSSLLVEDVQENPLTVDMVEGAYTASAYSLELEQTVEVSFVAIDGGSTTVTAVFEEPALTARILAPASVPGGTTFPVGWDGPNEQYDNIQIYPVDDPNARYDYMYVDRGNPLNMIAPFTPGSYEIRYVHKDRDVIGTALIEVTEAPVGLDAPAEVAVSSDFEVTWVGPNANGDNVQIGEVGESGYSNYMYTDRANPVTINAPNEPGTYELRYKFRDRQVIYTQPIEVTAVLATVSGPAEAVEGSTIAVAWTGPGYEYDYIGIGKVGAEGADAWDNFSYTRDGSPLELQVPVGAGDYVIGYYLGDGRKLLASTPITVTAAKTNVTAPAEAVAGSTIPVDWVGPDYENDYIGIGKPGATSSDAWENFAYTRDGNPLGLLTPTEPGDYVITYFMAQDRTPMASTKISIVEPQVSVTAPPTAIAGDTIAVDWVGPNYQNDYIGIGLVGAERSDQWENFTYTRDGAPVALLMPTAPGDYVISYFAGQDRSILASTTISVTAAEANLIAPPTAAAGSTIAVDWTGPDYQNDYIGIGLAGAERSDAWENFRYTRDGAPASLLVPTTPGDYVISYFSGQDRSILASTKIEVEELAVTVTAPATATAGSTIAVEWSGPDYDRDYIGIGIAGAERSDAWENFTYTEEGSPLSLLVPTTPGDYVISYFSGQDRAILASTKMVVEDIAAAVTTPDSVPAGSIFEVSWTGPDYDRDYIGVGLTGSDGNQRWEHFAYTDDGNPARVQAPMTPGDYTVTYFSGQDRSVLAETTLTITEVSATVSGPDSAIAGSDVEVTWDGPNYPRDYVGIGLAGESGNRQWESFAYTDDGNPLTITVPTTPGDYLITYFAGLDRRVMKSVPLTLLPIENVQLLAEDTVAAGTEVIVGWDGPAYNRDYIGIGRVGADGNKQWESFAYVGDGNPLTLAVPETTGDYLISYFLGQDRSIVKSRPLTVE